MYKLRRATLLLSLVGIFLWARTTEAATQVPTVHRPLEQQLFSDASDGRLDEFSMLEAALIAGGEHDAARIAQLICRLDAVIESLDVYDFEGDSHQRARLVLRFMHTRILTGRYRKDVSQLADALKSGDFNCLSATILFNFVARRMGLDVEAAETRGHVIARVMHGRPQDVETTCAEWFDVMADPARRAEIGRRLAGHDARDSLDFSVISDVQLVARVYYNRGVELFHERNFEAAVQATRRSLLLDGEHPAAQGNLLAGLNNYALALCDGLRFEEARRVIEELYRIAPMYGPLAANDLHVYQQWVLDLCRKGQFRQALGVLEAGFRRRPEADLFDRGRHAVAQLQERAARGSTAASADDWTFSPVADEEFSSPGFDELRSMN